MRNVLLCIALMFAGQSGSQVETPAVIISSINLSQEQVDVYRGFLSDYMAGPPATIHVADVTSTFAPDAGDFAGCMKRFSSTKPITEVHSLKDVFAGNKSVMLVDASKHTIQDPEDAMRQGTGVNEAVNKGLGAGLMTLSEIMIDPSHTQAAFSYSFTADVCVVTGERLVTTKKAGSGSGVSSSVEIGLVNGITNVNASTTCAETNFCDLYRSETRARASGWFSCGGT